MRLFKKLRDESMKADRAKAKLDLQFERLFHTKVTDSDSFVQGHMVSSRSWRSSLAALYGLAVLTYSIALYHANNATAHERENRLKAERIISFHRTYGTCPSNLNPTQLDHWYNFYLQEVENISN
ncbi:MAG: hypothetical protein HYS78_02270 [Parcubacteria group bacterium]|nr:hypothetical protein [Parcubacteria group bacterium]